MQTENTKDSVPGNSTKTTETVAFQAEINQLLDLMIHSLYSHHEIFLRELISNASDALDKRKFLSLTNPALLPDNTELEIQIEANNDERTLKIIDTGIGMTREEATKYLGTIAHSGTKELMKLAKADLANRPELIGQFGVGFYSAFMVSKKVIVHTQKAASTSGVLWISTGDGTYTLQDLPRPEGVGTSITLSLKDPEKDQDQETHDFSSFWEIKSLVKKYSDFVRYPIKMKNDKGEVETLNSMKALWLKAPSEIKEEEYNEFYQQIAHDYKAPAKVIHYKAEGTMEFTSLLYLPSEQPFNYFSRENEWGLNLFVKRVFIMNDCKDLLPPYLRFVKGMVDSSDLSLNVSREMLQQDRQVQSIKKSLTGKVLSTLKDFLTKERSQYETFWTQFGSTIKEGVTMDYANKDKLQELFLFHSSKSNDGFITFSEYVEKMPSDQKDIYFITGEDLKQLSNSPYIEKLKSKNYDVLLLNDPVDEWVMRSVGKYQEKNLQSITEDTLDLSSESEKEEIKDLTGRFDSLIKTIQTTLGDKIREVKVSSRLTDAPVCLVSAGQDPSAHMQRILEKLGKGSEMDSVKRVLEINPKHPVLERMLLSSTDSQKDMAEILYYQALLFEGSPLPDVKRFSELINKYFI
jgi:molecular chaperone HtpG